MDDGGKVLAKGQRSYWMNWIQQLKLAGYKWLVDY